MTKPATTMQGRTARLEAARLIAAVYREQQPFDELFAANCTTGPLQSSSARDRALVRHIAATTFRRGGQIDAVLSCFMTKSLTGKALLARAVLQTAGAQILFMRVPPRAAIHLAVDIVKSTQKTRHLAGLVNAVLRKVATEGPELVAAQDAGRLNTPVWLWDRWTRAYGEEIARRIAEAHLAEPPLDLSAKGSAEHWCTKLEGTLLPTGTIRIAGPHGAIELLPGFNEGAWWVQDLAAALPARLLGDVSGQQIADLCAAPGGKTLQLAAAGARVTAIDNSASRLERLTENLKRTGLSATVKCADIGNLGRRDDFDGVLLDAPCSATGTIRRHPDAYILKSQNMIGQFASRQADLLDRAKELVRPGGRLVYCTCSLEPEEGEQAAAGFLARHKDFETVPATADEIGGLDHLITPSGHLRTLPCLEAGPDITGMDGFFAARFRRKA